MPSFRVAVGAVTNDALQGETFQVIPDSGAVVNMWASSVTNGDTFGFLIGDRTIVPQGSEMNIEIAADVIDISRDQVVFNEVVPGGQLHLPVGALTTEAQFLVHLRYL